jgi:hypothetical protein
MEIITEYSLWFSLLCLALGAAYAWLLYYFKDSHLSDVSIWIKRSMALLRGLCVAVLAFLLLSPLIKTQFREVEKPIVVIAQDNSQSIKANKDSVYYKTTYLDQFNKLKDELSSKFEVKIYSFSDAIKDGFDGNYNGKQTNMADMMDDISNKYYNRNLSAVIIASDGIYNNGSNPLYAAEKLKAPIYTIALGDTTIRKDALIAKVNYNKTAFLGNSFPIEITTEMRKCKGEKVELSISNKDNVVISKTIIAENNNYKLTIPFVIDAKEKGIQHYKIKVSALANEINKTNNEKDVYIEVLEGKQKVLLLADAPHPDLSAIKQILEESQSYNVTNVTLDKFDGVIKQYNVVILHQLPGIHNTAASIITKIKEAKLPVLYVLGSSSSIPAFNALQTGLIITNSNNKTGESQPNVGDFSLFTLNDNVKKAINNFPPLISPYGTYKSNANTYSLLKQQIGSVKTDQPLLLFNQGEEQKTAVLAGEGLWKWRLRDYVDNGNQDASSELILKTIQYLAVKEEKTHFKVIAPHSFNENESVILNAEVYNDNYELINDPEASITITDKAGKAYPYTFSKTEKAYTLNAGYMAVGDYKYKATTKVGDKAYVVNGTFSVIALQIESLESTADHQLMYAIANKQGGAMVYPQQMEQLSKLLEARNDIKPVLYYHKQLNDLVNLKIVFFFLLLLLAAEWFMRKYFGAY